VAEEWSFALDLRFGKDVMASDCLALIKKLNSHRCSAVVHDIKQKASDFISISVVYVNRACNQVAHEIRNSGIHDVNAVWVHPCQNNIVTCWVLAGVKSPLH
jgi:hypothetical protein